MVVKDCDAREKEPTHEHIHDNWFAGMASKYDRVEASIATLARCFNSSAKPRMQPTRNDKF
jgi:hypothetical protein